MKKVKGDSDKQDLRKRAEATFQRRLADSWKPSEPSREETRRLIHELQVHQIELEIQNEELRRAQLELESARNKYSDLYDFAPVGYFTISDKGMILEANLTGAAMLGVERGLLIGNPLSLFITKNTQSAFYSHRQQLFETRAPQACELKLAKKHGSEFHAQLESTIVQDAEGNFSQFRTAMGDITERKRAEEELKRHRDQLEVLVGVRTSELRKSNEGLQMEIAERKQAEKEKGQLETQLQQAHKMEAIGTLAGGIAHDFNNILGIIVGNTELAMDDIPEWSPTQHSLKEVLKACLRAKDIVKQILAFSRQTELERKPVKLSPIIKECVKLMRSSIPTTIDIRQYISVESDTVSADATQINQVLINLCTNAAYAMAEKGGLLEIGLEDLELDEDAVGQYQCLKPGDYVRLTVSDTGHGIEPEIMGRIFDPYFTTREVDQGTGMGLAVVHGIVKSHGGVITVDSEPGKGATFRILLPTVESEVIPEAEAPEAIPGGSERILFVDDEQPLVNLTRQVLERLGYDVVTRAGSLEALEVFRAQPDKFDLVITDMTMPHMTGDRLAKEVIRIRPDIPIILCTGHSDRIDELRAKAMGIRAFVMKPFLKRGIAESIRTVLDKK